MNNQPQIRVPGFPAIELNSSVAIDRAAPEQLLWKADGSVFTAATPGGTWKLVLAERDGRIDAAFTGTLNKPAEFLDVTLFNVPSFAADHVLPQAVRMGGCQAYDLTAMEDSAAFTGELLASVTKNGVTLQCSTPVHGGFPVLFQ